MSVSHLSIYFEVSYVGISHVGISYVGTSSAGISSVGISYVGISSVGISHVGIIPANGGLFRRSLAIPPHRYWVDFLMSDHDTVEASSKAAVLFLRGEMYFYDDYSKIDNEIQHTIGGQ